jgi:hypothetical protein
MAAEPMQLVELTKFIPPFRYNRLKRAFRFGIDARSRLRRQRANRARVVISTYAELSRNGFVASG